MNETRVHIETIRTHEIRASYGPLDALGESVLREGLRHPITVWQDGTLISGARRLRCHFLLSGRQGGSQFKLIPAVFVDTIEEAAKRLLEDNQDTEAALPMKWSEVCRLWALLRRLDEPAAAKRLTAARRRGVELRKATQSGKRKPGRASSRTDDYALTVLAEPFGISSASARRIEVIFQTATGVIPVTDERRTMAAEILTDLDNGGTIWANYQRLTGAVHAPRVRKRTAGQTASVDAQRQIAAWGKALPQLEGLVAGLIELGPPNPELTWEQVGPVHTRLAVARRSIEKMIKEMKEFSA